jgi:glutaryl-CoA dehydrogenase
MCLTQARYGIAWGAIGAAMACYDEALRYAQSRVMFDRPIAQTQIQQVRLVDMLTEIVKAQFMTLQLGRLKDAGTMTPDQVSLCKRNNVDMACDAAREACSALTASWPSITPCATWRTWSRSTPTRAPTTCTP